MRFQTTIYFCAYMPRQQKTESRNENGRSIAKKTRVKRMTVHPIDTLLVQQLENLLDGERALKARYSALDPSLDTPEVRMAFSKELSDLKERADRLYRFVNAMDYYGSLDYTAFRPAAGAGSMAMA